MTKNTATLSSILNDDEHTLSITVTELERLGFKDNGMFFDLYEFFYENKKILIKLTSNIITSKIFYIKNDAGKYVIHRDDDLPASFSYRYDIESNDYICFEKDWRLYDKLVRIDKDLPISHFIYPDKSHVFYFYIDKTDDYKHRLQLYEYFNQNGHIKYEFFFLNQRIMMKNIQGFFTDIDDTSYESLINFANGLSSETLKLFEMYIQ